MGKTIGPPLKPRDVKWIEQQKIFFNATAPISTDQHVNVSPKSADLFRIVDENTVCYLDTTGSGSETIAHLNQNGRITILFVALTGYAQIVRLFGKGYFLNKNEARLDPKISKVFTHEEFENKGFRCVIIIKLDRISQSCGKSIPYFQYEKPRKDLDEFYAAKGRDNIIKYQAHKNSYSIDGIPSFGLFDQKRAPMSTTCKGGYWLSEYDQVIKNEIDLNSSKQEISTLITGHQAPLILEKNTPNFLYLGYAQFMTNLKMKYISAGKNFQEYLIVFCLGMLFGALLVKLSL